MSETHFSCDTVDRGLWLAILSSLLCPETGTFASESKVMYFIYHIKVIPHNRTFDIGDYYMTVTQLRLLYVTEVQDGDTCKKTIATPKRFVDEVEQLKTCAMKNTPKKDNNLYDIEVTQDDKEKICIKIHYVGYGNEFDE